jgi:hypothetical protein
MSSDEYRNRYASERTVRNDMDVVGLTVLHQALLREIWVHFDLICYRMDLGSLE